MIATETQTGSEPLESLLTESVMLYDGKCVFCNGATTFVLKHEDAPIVKFAPLQSEPGLRLLEHFGLPTDVFKTFVVVTGGNAYTRYEAAIQLGYLTGGRWAKFARVMDVIVPDFIGNTAYSILWPLRKVFGAKDQCIVPSPEQRQRQLGGAEVIVA